MLISLIRKHTSFILVLALAACSSASSTHHRAQVQQTSIPPVWQTIQSGLGLQHYTDQPPVQTHYQRYCKHAYQIQQTLQDTLPTLSTIAQVAIKDNLPSELILIPYIESHYNPLAYSRTGAAGLWQIMPGTASGLGLRINWWIDQRKDMLASTEAALDYLDYLYHYFGDNWLLAIAAYDSGEGTVKSAIRKNRMHHKPTNFWSLPLPKETKVYVPKLLALAEIIQHPERCDLALPNENGSQFTAIAVPQQLTLTQLAQGAHVDIGTLTELNPQFSRAMTEYNQPHQKLLLPPENAQYLQSYLLNVKDIPVHWQHHQVHTGDTLASIAQQFGSQVTAIQMANHIATSTVRSGQHLLIPVGSLIHGHIVPPTMDKQSYFKLGPQQTLHTIMANESLSQIAKQYHITTGMIRFWNPENAKLPLQVGKRLVIWLPRQTHFDIYIVKSGDSLGSIAQKAGVSVRTIQQANRLIGHIIFPDQVLQIPMAKKPGLHHTLPSIYTVKRGDSIYAIAHRHRIPVKNLLDWNQLMLSSVLHPGQTLTIYR